MTDKTREQVEDGFQQLARLAAEAGVAKDVLAEMLRAHSELAREVEQLVAQNSTLHRERGSARHIARFLWRLDGVREQWTPPAKYELDWLTREDAS